MKHPGMWAKVLASTIIFGSTLAAGSLAPIQAATLSGGQTAANGLTTAEQAQAAKAARTTEQINTITGYVSVSTTALANQGLTPSQLSYADRVCALSYAGWISCSRANTVGEV